MLAAIEVSLTVHTFTTSLIGSSMLFPILVSLLFCSGGATTATHPDEAEQVSKQAKGFSGLCPDEWINATPSGLGCIYFNSTAGATWEEASSWCQHPDNNASLLEIWSELQFDFVRSELMFLQDNGVDGDWWVGGTDLGREGH